MLNSFKRLWNILRGKAHKTLDQFENPAEQLSVFVADLNKQHQVQHQAVAKAMADERRLKLELEDLTSLSQDWEKKALYALQMKDEELARQALLKKEEVVEKVFILETTWQQQKKATDHLRLALQSSKESIDEAKRKYNLLAAQYQAALSKKQISQSVSQMNENSSGAIIENLKNKIFQIEAETEASDLLHNSGNGDELDKKFKALENKMKSDRALEQLKEKMASSIGDKSVNQPLERDVTTIPAKKVGNQ